MAERRQRGQDGKQNVDTVPLLVVLSTLRFLPRLFLLLLLLLHRHHLLLLLILIVFLLLFLLLLHLLLSPLILPLRLVRGLGWGNFRPQRTTH
jgi:hypothetical protein